MMTNQSKPIDVSGMPELARLIEEIRKTGRSRVLTRDDQEVAIVTPVTPHQSAQAGHRTGILTKDDPVWNLVGRGHSGIGDISANKHKYLAEAYIPRRRRS